MTLPRALLAAVLLLCVAAQTNAQDLPTNGDAATLGGRRLLAPDTEAKMMAWCSKPKNQASAKCTQWVESHELFQDLEGKAAQLKALIADKSDEVAPSGGRATPAAYDPVRGLRLAKYASAARCKWSALSKWNCSTCNKIGNAVILAAYEGTKPGRVGALPPHAHHPLTCPAKSLTPCRLLLTLSSLCCRQDERRPRRLHHHV